MFTWDARLGSVASRIVDGGMAPVLLVRTRREET
jgi:hypothetical protein